MAKQYLFYTSDDMYSYDIRLLKQIFYRDGHPTGDHEGPEYVAHYKARFSKKEWSALHIMVLDLDPVNGVTTIVTNEFMQHPLKNKIVINQQVLVKRQGLRPYPTITPAQELLDSL